MAGEKNILDTSHSDDTAHTTLRCISAIVPASLSNFPVHPVFSFAAVSESRIFIKKKKKKRKNREREKARERRKMCAAQMFVYSFIYLLLALNEHNAVFAGAECVFLHPEVHFDTILRAILFFAA